ETGQVFIALDADQCTILFMLIGAFKTGVSRNQSSFLPPCLEDYVAPNNPVRAIDVFVEALDLDELGFKVPAVAGGAGQPPYHPGDLLKLYIYGYMYRIRSSRALAERRDNCGRIEIRYTSRKADCDACPLRPRCLAATKTPTRTVCRWVHEAVLERHRARMMNAAGRVRRRDRRTPLRHPQMPRRLPALPGAGLCQGARRMEPDGVVLQPLAGPHDRRVCGASGLFRQTGRRFVAVISANPPQRRHHPPPAAPYRAPDAIVGRD